MSANPDHPAEDDDDDADHRGGDDTNSDHHGWDDDDPDHRGGDNDDADIGPDYAEVKDDHADDDVPGGDRKLHQDCSSGVGTCADQTSISVANASIQRF